jgi:hypothetical protein
MRMRKIKIDNHLAFKLFELFECIRYRHLSHLKEGLLTNYMLSLVIDIYVYIF